MPTNVEVPSLGESVTEAVLLRWLKNDGDHVAADEPLVELETDKANVDIPSPAAGVFSRVKEAGETVHIGETIARISEAPAGAKPPAPAVQAPVSAAAAQATAPHSPDASPAAPPRQPTNTDDLRPSVRRLVEENKLNPATIPGTGPGGRILKEDVLNRLADSKASEDANGNGTDSAPATAPTARQANPAASTPQPTSSPTARSNASLVFDQGGTKRVPMSKMRKRIAENLVLAQQTAAILTTFNEIDLTRVLELRAKYKERFTEVYGVSLGLMSFFARAAVLALREFPRVNARIDGDDIIYHDYVNLGIAVSTDRGLAVPVLSRAEQMSFARIESEIKRLANATREGKLSLHELSGGTFTITNGGVFGSLLSTPIVNPPQSGILGMHAIQKRPMAINDKVEIRPMMYVALSYDHRLVDGKESVSFLVRLKEYLEDPARLMLEV